MTTHPKTTTTKLRLKQDKWNEELQAITIIIMQHGAPF